MKANEVRIGNYVYNTKGEVDIIDIDAINYLLRYGTINCQVTPIPITEEILLKCGFEKKQYSCRNEYYYFINDIVLVKGQKTIVESDYDGNITFALPLFVHQLQNLIFTIIGEELIIQL